MRTVAGALCALMLCLAPAAAQETPIPVEAFGNLPAIADAAISPDGTKIALAMSRGGESVVNVVDLNAGRSIFAATVEAGSQLRGISFASDDHVAFVLSRTFRPGEVLPVGMRFVGSPRRVDYYRNGVIKLSTGEMQLITTDERGWADSGGSLIAPIEGDPGFGRLIGGEPGLNYHRPAVFRVNLDSGSTRVMPSRGVTANTLGFMLAADGSIAARIDSDEDSNRWRVFVMDDGRPRLLLEDVSEWGEPIDLEGFLEDGRIAALDEVESGEYYALYAIDPATGARDMLFQRDNAEINGAISDPWTRQVVGVSWTDDETEQHFFDSDLSNAYDGVRALFEDGSATLSSWSRDRSSVLVYAERGLDGGGYYVYTPATNNLRRISMRYPALADAQIGVRQAITYRARDEVRIPAYLTLPPVENARNLPLVLLVHGGPHSRDTFDFDWWASFLASRGYAVLQPNFRGSTGYGASWEFAGRRQWGGLMQTDVEDGVAALIRAGIADGNRVCIVGASYGGYAALAGATLTPDRYKCAVSVAGVSDLVEFLRQREIQSGGDESMQSDFWRSSIGDRAEDRERIRSVSPANLADRVQIPILLMHGTDDTIVPLEQSRRMHTRLRDAGKNVRFVELRGDDHWLSDAPTRIQMLRELETFLAQNIGTPAE